MKYTIEKRDGQNTFLVIPLKVDYFLEAILARDREFLTTVTTAGGENAAAVGGRHTLTKSVFVATLTNRGLECPFHISYYLFSHLGLQR